MLKAIRFSFFTAYLLPVFPSHGAIAAKTGMGWQDGGVPQAIHARPGAGLSLVQPFSASVAETPAPLADIPPTSNPTPQDEPSSPLTYAQTPTKPLESAQAPLTAPPISDKVHGQAASLANLAKGLESPTAAAFKPESAPNDVSNAGQDIIDLITGEKKRPHVVIVGGGFGGLYSALTLNRRGVRVTLVDRQNHHVFQPLLYQVATAQLSPAEISQPIRHILRKSPDTRVLLGEATAVDLENRRIVLADGNLSYDRLILAAGARTAYYGHPEWEQYAPSLKGIDDALEIRRRVLLAFEAAEREADEKRRETLLTFIVIGGGPTGVELAGAISELARSMAGEFRTINPSRARVLLLEGGPRILPFLDGPLGEAARKSLAERGVEVRTDAMVTQITKGQVRTKTEELAADTILWASGVDAAPLSRTLGVPLDRAGRVLVERDLTISGHPEVSVIGDLAAFLQEGKQLPGLAPVAIQMGRHAAKNILRSLKGKPPLPFRYRSKGVIAVIGRHAAVGKIGPWNITGFPAWAAWLLVHVLFLIGLRNRLRVTFEWLWSYFTSHKGTRLITGRR